MRPVADQNAGDGAEARHAAKIAALAGVVQVK
jgi:hypothetical protein